MEHTSDTVYDGKLLHGTSYPQRAQKYSEVTLSVQWENIPLTGKIDFYDAKVKTIHEIKRGKSVEKAHTLQLRFYIWLFQLYGIAGAVGRLEYPRLRKTTVVVLTEVDRKYLEETVQKVAQLIEQKQCPPVINTKICKSCSYYELCYIDEL